MDHIDNVRTRCAALEPQTARWRQQTRMVERPPRGWRLLWRVAALVALGLALTRPPAVQAETLHCGAGDVQCLIDAINTANANGQENTIRLEAGTYTLTTPIDVSNSLPVIASRLTITGQGSERTILERDPDAPRFRLLQVNAPGSLTVTRMTLRGGGGSPGGRQGAAILNNGGTLELVHVILVQNFGGDGAIVNGNGRVTITSSIIDTNGGANESGGLNNEGGTVVITESTFSHNVADGPGAIENNGTMEISASTFLENRVVGTGSGGAIANLGTLEVVNTTFARNRVSIGFPFVGQAAAIANYGVLFLARNERSCHQRQSSQNSFVFNGF